MKNLTPAERLAHFERERDEGYERCLAGIAAHDREMAMGGKAQQLWAQDKIDNLLAEAAPLIGDAP